MSRTRNIPGSNHVIEVLNQTKKSTIACDSDETGPP